MPQNPALTQADHPHEYTLPRLQAAVAHTLALMTVHAHAAPGVPQAEAALQVTLSLAHLGSEIDAHAPLNDLLRHLQAQWHQLGRLGLRPHGPSGAPHAQAQAEATHPAMHWVAPSTLQH